jgi:hypothetical protein
VKVSGKTRGEHVLKSKRRRATYLRLIIPLSGADQLACGTEKPMTIERCTSKGRASATPKTDILRCKLSRCRNQANRKPTRTVAVKICMGSRNLDACNSSMNTKANLTVDPSPKVASTDNQTPFLFPMQGTEY